MKYHATFFHVDLAGKLSEACGDRAVIILDGRISSRSMHAVSADECKKRGYLAYQIHEGPRFTDSRPVSGVIRVGGHTDLETVSERVNAKGVK